MLRNLNTENILFLDIETVPQVPSYGDLNPAFRKLWDKKAEKIRKNEADTPEMLYERAGIYAEFGKVICISVAFIKSETLRVKSYYGDDEKKLLEEFSGLLSYLDKQQTFLCAHNGKEFDYPYLCRRMLVNGLPLPDILDISGKKPWEVNHLDTMELWKFGDYKNYTSLELLTTLFGIPTSKDEMDGSEVAGVYWDERNLEKIVKYCQKDTICVAQLILKYAGKPLIAEENIVFT